MTEQIKDAFGYPVEGELPKLDRDLLEEMVNWAIRSHNGKLEPGTTKWYQGDYFRSLENIDKTVDYIDGYGFISPAASVEDICDTAACMAGNAMIATDNVTNDGWNFLVPKDVIEVRGELVDIAAICNSDEGSVSAWHVGGMQLFGLTDEEAAVFFAAGNSISDIVQFAKKIAEHRGETLDLEKVKSDD